MRPGTGQTEGTHPAELDERLADEIADMLCHALLLAEHHQVDLPAAIRRKWLSRVRGRVPGRPAWSLLTNIDHGLGWKVRSQQTNTCGRSTPSQPEGRKLRAAGADFFLVACNTVHAVAHHIERAVGLPFLRIVDPTARRIPDGGFTAVGLLGSRYTMTGGYFVDRLKRHCDVTVLIAEAEHRDNVRNALFEELAKGIYLDGTRGQFKMAIADLVVRFGSSSGLVRPSGGIAQIQAAGAVQRLFRATGGRPGGQDLVLIATAAGQIQPEAPRPG